MQINPTIAVMNNKNFIVQIIFILNLKIFSYSYFYPHKYSRLRVTN